MIIEINMTENEKELLKSKLEQRRAAETAFQLASKLVKTTDDSIWEFVFQQLPELENMDVKLTLTKDGQVKVYGNNDNVKEAILLLEESRVIV